MLGKLVFAILALALLVFPPWQRPGGYHPEFGHRPASPMGHAFVGNGPEQGSIAWGTLLAEVAAAGVVGFIAACFAGRKGT